MTDSSKKVEVRFGAFACTIEGYDDPVAQMREVLGMMQRMISETPALAEATDFNAEQVEDALKDSGDGASPGVVVIRSAEPAAETAEPPSDVAAPEAPVEEPAEASVQDVEPEPEEPAEVAADTLDNAEVATDTLDTAADVADEPATADDADTANEATGVAAAAAAAVGVGVAATEILSDGPVEPAAAEPDPAPVSDEPTSSTAAWLAAQRARARVAESAAEQTVAREVEAPEPQPVEPDSQPAEADAVSATPEPEADDAGSSFNIFAAPPTPDPVEPLIETASAEPLVEDSPAPETSVTDVEEAVEILSDEVVHEMDVPSYDPPTEVAEEDPAPISAADPAPNIFAAAPEPVSSPEPEPAPALEPEPAPAPEPEPEPPLDVRPMSMQNDVPPAQPEAMNIFANPATPVSEPVASEPIPEPQAYPPEPEPEPEEIADPAPEPSSFNIFARPDAAAPPDLSEQVAATPEPEPAPQPEPEPQPDPEPARQKPSPHGAFTALLKRVQGGASMSAPGENTPETSAPASATNISAAEFVGKTNATQVTDLLAGSAAWLTLVQGKTRFTRREVMEVFDTVPGDHPKTLEARIKGFGKLVRSGTLILIDDGVFAMAQNDRDRFQQYLS